MGTDLTPDEMMFAWQKKYYLMISSNSDSLKKMEEFRNVANTIPLESSLVMANDGDYSLLLMTFLDHI